MVNLADPQQPLPGSIVARRVGVSRQLLADWVGRGLLTPAERTPTGRPLYRVADAAAAEQQTRCSATSTRRRRNLPDPAPADPPGPG